MKEIHTIFLAWIEFYSEILSGPNDLTMVAINGKNYGDCIFYYCHLTYIINSSKMKSGQAYINMGSWRFFGKCKYEEQNF